MLVAYYFLCFFGRNPFGIAGLDVKSIYAGMMEPPYTSSGKADMVPRFSEVVPRTHQARDDAIAQPNFVKVTKRLYNLFRVTDDLEAAAYVSEVFDEPGALIYQAPGLLASGNVAMKASPAIIRDIVVQQIDHVNRVVVEAALGHREADLVTELIRFQDGVIGRLQTGQEWDKMMGDLRFPMCASAVRSCGVCA